MTRAVTRLGRGVCSATMGRRLWLLFGASGLLAAGLLAAACGTSSGGKGGSQGPDAGVDSSKTTPDGTVSDSSTPDSTSTGNDSAPPVDSGMGMMGDTGAVGSDTGTTVTDAGDGGVTDATLAHCSPILGSCDIVSQNCGAGMECIAVEDPDGGPSEITVCSPTQPSEHLPAGHACCPSGTNPCDPGLECIGNECSLDAAAPQTGRCSPHCCLGPDGGDDTPCGVSVPEGYPGHCDSADCRQQQQHAVRGLRLLAELPAVPPRAVPLGHGVRGPRQRRHGDVHGDSTTRAATRAASAPAPRATRATAAKTA